MKVAPVTSTDISFSNLLRFSCLKFRFNLNVTSRRLVGNNDAFNLFEKGFAGKVLPTFLNYSV